MSKKGIERENFGPGLAGERAFNLIKIESSCQECGGEATHTLDFDVLGDLEQILVCDKCLPEVERKVREDLAKIGRLSNFGVNGRGRA